MLENTIELFLVYMDMEQVYLVNFQMNNVLLARIKYKKTTDTSIKGGKVIKNQTTKLKGQDRIVYLM